MSRGVTSRLLPSLSVVLWLLACGGSPPPPPAPTPLGPITLVQVLTGTCKAYDLGASTMDVIAGVSFAVREVTFRIHDQTVITIRDRRAGLTDMRAGMVVRVEYRVTPQGNLADKVEVVLDATGMR